MHRGDRHGRDENAPRGYLSTCSTGGVTALLDSLGAGVTDDTALLAPRLPNA
ncbi:hypothetical protein ABZV91_13640 [Nocardia sp. NPDC004568]|uniref:hypothetical protein n=1 Tax=Nocardia sp. NPDC004568 TaxID=3154551 RepID=UPI0033BD803E